MLGFAPYLAFSVWSNFEYHTFKKSEGEYQSSSLNLKSKAISAVSPYLPENSEWALSELDLQLKINFMSLVALRMQNIEYKNNNSLRATLKDIYKLDGSLPRAAVKGLVPFYIARKILEQTVVAANES